MAFAITLEDVKTLLRFSTNLKPEPAPLGAKNSVDLPHPEPYKLRPSQTTCDVRTIVKDGLTVVVKFGTRVYPREAEIMAYVASRTSIPIPRVYAVFHEAVGKANVTYIIQEHLPGTQLQETLQFLTPSERAAITSQLRETYAQLRGLTDGRTQLGPFGGGSWARTFWFQFLQRAYPIGDEDARTTRSFLAYFQGITSVYDQEDWTLDEFLSFFDLDRAPIFSHGDLAPWNILVHDGRISAVVDWAEAGWYPYFWDSFVLDRGASRLKFLKVAGAQEMLRASLPEFFPEGTKFSIHWASQFDFYW